MRTLPQKFAATALTGARAGQKGAWPGCNLGVPHLPFAEYSGSRPDSEYQSPRSPAAERSGEYPESSVMMAETHNLPENRGRRYGWKGSSSPGRRSARS